MRSLIDAYLLTLREPRPTGKGTSTSAPNNDRMKVGALNKGKGKGKSKGKDKGGKDKGGKGKGGTKVQSDAAKNNANNKAKGAWSSPFQGYCGGW